MPSKFNPSLSRRGFQPQQALRLNTELGFMCAAAPSAYASRPLYAGPGLHVGARSSGVAWVDGGQSDDQLGLMLEDDMPLSEGTVVLMGAQTNDIYDGGIFGIESTGFSAMIAAGAEVATGTMSWFFDASVTPLSVSGLAFSDSDVWVMTNGPRGQEIWRNGLLLAAGAQGTRAYLGIGTRWGLGGLANWSSRLRNVGNYYGLAFSRRQLSAQLCESIRTHADGWSVMCLPTKRRAWIPVSGIPVLSAATLTSITNTTAVPQVTVTF